MKTIVAFLAGAWVAVACSRISPEMQVIHDAAEALGGQGRILQIKTLVIEGEGTAPNLGQNITPDSDLPVWKVTKFSRVIDPANSRMRVKQVREAQFLFAGATVQSQDYGVDGDVAYAIGQDGTPARASEWVARERQREILHHPIAIIRTALQPDSKVSNVRSDGDVQVVDVTTAKGDMFTLAINGTTKLPARVSSMSYN